MKLFSILRSLDSKVIVGIVSLTVMAGFGLRMEKSHAVVSNLTGSCGMLYSVNTSGLGAMMNGGTHESNTLVLVNFDAGTIQSNTMLVSGFGQAGATTSSTGLQNNTFTQAVGPITGSYQLTLSGGDKVNLLAVNSGNTFLVQFVGQGTTSKPGSGVCQRV